MKKQSLISLLFYLAALYDGILGLAFLFLAPSIYNWYGIAPPNHYGYIHFPAALLIVFALLYFAVARNQIANRNLIPYGMLLKVSYCSVVFYYWFFEGIPAMWKPFAIYDLIFLILFGWAYWALRSVDPPAHRRL